MPEKRKPIKALCVKTAHMETSPWDICFLKGETYELCFWDSRNPRDPLYRLSTTDCRGEHHLVGIKYICEYFEWDDPEFDLLCVL